jgi:hypothetical protein
MGMARRIVLTFKTPDVVESAMSEFKDPEGVPSEVEDAVNKFVQYGEVLRVEIDIDTQTATVLPVR